MKGQCWQAYLSKEGLDIIAYIYGRSSKSLHKMLYEIFIQNRVQTFIQNEFQKLTNPALPSLEKSLESNYSKDN